MTSNAPAPLPIHEPVEREWLVDCNCAGPVIQLLRNCGWDTVADPDGNVHCASLDRRVFVGFLPESPEAAFGEVWQISVHGPDRRRAWSTSFGHDVPAQAIAGFLAALVAYPDRWCSSCM